MSEKSKNLLGIVSVCFLTFFISCAYFGNLFDKLNRVSFATGGDGVQSYINMEYHIRYDSTYMRCNSMNYPYGEHVFFTNNQPLISNSIRFISGNFVDISGYTLGILNFIMLLSLFITPLIIYGIFRHLKTGRVLSVISSIPIAFLTPQMDRLGGHYNLSYVCAIPLMILLLLKFFQKPSILLSVLIFLTMMAGALTHFYFYGFFALLLIFLYANAFYHKKTFSSNLVALSHLFVQLILPFLILQIFYISDHITDRPGYPWGFLLYRAFPLSIFLPLDKPYGQFIHSIYFLNTGKINWEGYAIIGTTASFGTLYFVLNFADKIIKKKYRSLWKVVDNRLLNIIFWASVAGLLYSFGLPFIFGLQGLVDLIGPIRQMRGIGRFAWIFYYVINIVTIYWLWCWWKSEKRKITLVITTVAIFILYLDTWYNIHNRGELLENELPVISDSALSLPENQWINRVNIKDYQAFIPLPYFHVGSENIWIDGGCDIVKQSFTVIKNSGLPCMGVMLSRTSISQTLENVSSITSPTCDHLEMQRFPSEKPFLLLVAKCEIPNWHEKELIRHAQRVDSSGAFDIYHLPFHAFLEIQDSLNKTVYKEFTDKNLFRYEACFSSDSSRSFVFLNYDRFINVSMYGKGCLTGKAKDRTVLYSGPIPVSDTVGTFVLSFWINDIKKDLYPRTEITISEMDSTGKQIYELNFPVFRQIVQVSQNKALIEYKFKKQELSKNITISANNTTLRNKEIEFDNFLLRPDPMNIYFDDAKYVWKNNYYYCK